MSGLLKTLSSKMTWLTALGAVVVLLCGALGASAYVTTTGSGIGTAPIGNLGAPSITSATPGPHSVVLHWSSVTPPEAGPVTYSVTRLGGSVGGTCPTSASPGALLTCTDSPLADGTYDYTVTAAWRTWTTTSAPVTATVTTADTIAPTVTSIVSTDTDPTNAAVVHWTVAFSEDVTGVDTGDFDLARIGVNGGSVTSVTPVSGSVYTVAAATGSGSGTLGVNLVDDDSIADGAGNRLGGTGTSGGGAGSFIGQLYTVDKTAPATVLSLTAQSPAGGTLRVGDTIFYRGTGGGSGGSFRIQNAVSDSGSGPASSTTEALAGAGWSHAPSTVSSPAGGPYDTNVFTWAEGTTSSPTEVVTAADAVGNTTAATLTLTDDSAAPTGGALSVNGQPAGTVGYSGSTGFPIGARADYADAGSGLASSTLTLRSHSLADGACGAAAGPFSSPVTVSGTTQPGGIVTGFCYLYTLTGTDNVGNAADLAVTVIVAAPSLTVDTASVVAGGTLTATWSGIANPTPKDWLGLYLPSSAADSHAHIEWIYDSSCTKTPGVPASSGSCAFTIPSSTPAGTYELRLLPNDVFSPLVATSGTFTVTA